MTPVPVSPGVDAGRVCPRALQGRKANQAYTAFHGERGQFGMDAEIRTHQALHEAKPSECPKGIGIINQKFSSKTDFFSKLNLYISVCRKNNIFLKWGLGRSPKAGRRDASPRFLPRHGCRAVYATRLCRRKVNQAYTAFHEGKGERGIGIINSSSF